MLDGWIIYAISSVAIGFISGTLGGLFHLGTLRRRVRAVEYGLADLEGELLSEKRKRAADSRWKEKEVAEPSQDDLEALEKHVVGSLQGNFLRGKEGGVFRGPR